MIQSNHQAFNYRLSAILFGGSCHCFLLSLIVLYGSSCAQPPLIANAKLNEGRLHDTVSRVSDASGLRVNRPLSVTVVNRNELLAIYQEGAAARNQSDLWRARQAGYSTMGFLSGEWQDVYENVTLFSRSTAGLYVPKKQSLFVVSEPARSEKGGIFLNSLGQVGNDLTLAHEIVHALQHQHYPEVFDFDAQTWLQQSDAIIALQAAIEGDANYWAARSLGFMGRARDPEEVLELSRDTKFSPLSEVPSLARERIEFPYIYGYRFAYSEGKDSLNPPPASAEQVIHIKDKGRTAFLAIDLSEVGSMVERTTGCHVNFQDTMGELMLSLWLRSFASSTDKRIWEGWDGDRWLAVECEHSRELIWLMSWDTEQDAQEFEQALSVISGGWQQRAKLRSSLLVERRGREIVVISEGLRFQMGDLKQLAKEARVTTRAELASHFAKTIRSR